MAQLLALSLRLSLATLHRFISDTCMKNVVLFGHDLHFMTIG